MSGSIFHKYYHTNKLIDRKTLNDEDGIDVIMPILNTNELFETNLYSFYREIPINRLLIGDGGSTDESIEIAKKFPRVIIFNQKHLKTLGYRLRCLIEKVKTEWFIYLHSDVFLPEGWYDEMRKHQNEYDWYECFRKITILVEYNAHNQNVAKRPYSGSQMGKTEAFKNIKVDDDYLYRNEDIIFSELIESEGFKYGRISDTFHYHQVMNKRGETEPKFKKVNIEREFDKKWEIETVTIQVKGIIKYLEPKGYLIDAVNLNIATLLNYNALDWKEFKKWVKDTNKDWLKHINRKRYYIRIREVVYSKAKRILKKYFRKYYA